MKIKKERVCADFELKGILIKAFKNCTKAQMIITCDAEPDDISKISRGLAERGFCLTGRRGEPFIITYVNNEMSKESWKTLVYVFKEILGDEPVEVEE